MQKLTFVPPGGNYYDPGSSVVISTNRNTKYVLGSPRGTGAVPVQFKTIEPPTMDGEFIQSVRLGSRVVSDTIHIRGRTRREMYTLRERLCSMLNPALGAGTLHYENDNIHVQCEAYAENYGEFHERIQNYNRATIEFRCPNPYWRSAYLYETEIYDFAPGGRFPVSNIYNRGNVPAPIVLSIPASSYFYSMTIKNTTTGKQLNLDGSGYAAVIVNTERGQRKITTTGDGTVTASGDWIELIPGDNIIEISSNETSVSFPKTTISHRALYAGV